MNRDGAPSPTRPSLGLAWLAAVRPKTLPAGVAPVLVGSAFAWRDAVFDGGPAAAALGGALLIQIGTNLANDYHDHKRGADAPDRLGPPRATASGWIAPRQVAAGAIVAFSLAAALGIYLVFHAGWPILLVGIVSIASGWAYTAGPYPLGYHGWGDAFVFVFFGPVAVAGTYYVQGGPAPMVVVAAGIAVGSLATAVLVVNNLRDHATDARVGKRTLAVILGRRATRAEYSILLALAYAVPIGLVVANAESLFLLLPLISLPVALLLARAVATERDAARLNPLLGATAQLLALFGVLLSAAVVAA